MEIKSIVIVAPYLTDICANNSNQFIDMTAVIVCQYLTSLQLSNEPNSNQSAEKFVKKVD